MRCARAVAVSVTAVLVAALAVVVTAPAASATPVAAGTYRSVTPFRALDTRHTGGAIAAHKTRTVQLGGRGTIPSSGVSAVAVTITAIGPAAAGGLVAYATGATAPSGSDVRFGVGHSVSSFAVSRVSTTGSLTLANASARAINATVDVSGYYVGGVASSTDPGVFHPLSTQTRVVSTSTALAPGKSITTTLGGHYGLPSSVGAVAMVLKPVSPTRSGGLIAYAKGNDRPTRYSARFAGGQESASFAVVPTDRAGGITIANSSSGSVKVVADVVGWYPPGVATTAGATQPRFPARVVNGQSVGAAKTVSVTVGGKGGVPRTGVSTVLAVVTAYEPTASGALGTSGSVANLVFASGSTTSNLVALPVTNGRATLVNRSHGSFKLYVDVVGFVPSATLTVPQVSISRYLGDLTGSGTQDPVTMSDHGCDDADAGSTFVLLDVGAQTVTSLPSPGVSLANVPDPDNHPVRLVYADLVSDIDSYLDGFSRCQPAATATVAVGTNTSGVWTAGAANYYSPTDRGTDWANDVVDAITPHGGITVVGADDIEPGFDATQSQALTWEHWYLNSTNDPNGKLIFNGSADGCPDGYGDTTNACLNGFTMSGINYMASARDRIQALPQIYGPSFAAQWANIDATGGDNLTFPGVRTEHATDPTTYTPQSGYAALHYAIGTLVDSPAIPLVTDITSP